jgi:hypothetical protein
MLMPFLQKLPAQRIADGYSPTAHQFTVTTSSIDES